MKIYIQLEIDPADFRIFDTIANQMNVDIESAIRYIIRRGIQSMMQPPMPVGEEIVENKEPNDKKKKR